MNILAEFEVEPAGRFDFSNFCKASMHDVWFSVVFS